MNRTNARWFLLFALILATAACSDTPTPVTPTTPTTLEEPPWTGTLTPFGLQSFPFVSTAAGQISATVFSLSPNDDSSARIGLAIGKWDGQACEWAVTNDAAAQLTVLYATATSGGSICVSVNDAHGKLTAPLDFDIRITHP